MHVSIDGRFATPSRVPEGEHFDPAGFCVDLVVEMITSATQKQTAYGLLLRVASLRPNTRLVRNQFEGSFQIDGECERGCRTVGSPPNRGSPDLRRSSGRGLDGQT